MGNKGYITLWWVIRDILNYDGHYKTYTILYCDGQ